MELNPFECTFIKNDIKTTVAYMSILFSDLFAVATDLDSDEI